MKNKRCIQRSWYRPIRESIGVILALLAILALSSAFGIQAQTGSPALTPQAYLPLVLKSPACALSPEEAEIARYMREHPDQRRPSLTCHPILARVARERAEDMARRRYFSHVNPDGYGPNYLVRQAGYVLPSYYDQAPDANNIESIAAGYPNAAAVWNGWMSSEGHRTHLLGLHPFFAEQIEYGIGYTYDLGSPYRYYWVVITARPGP